MIDFTKYSLTKFRTIREIVNSMPHDKFVGVPMTGDSLKEIGILHGDILVTRITNKFQEDKLCVWQTPKGRTIKFGYINFDETVLHNKNECRQSWNSNEIQLIGIVVRVERDLEVTDNRLS